MAAIETYAASSDISGKRFLAALGAAVGTSAVTGALSYVLLRFLDSSSRSQAIVFIVYTTLVVTLCAFFSPVTKAPIGLRFTSLKHLLASVGLLIATLGVTALSYRLMSPVFGDLFSLVRQIAALPPTQSAYKVSPLRLGSSRSPGVFFSFRFSKKYCFEAYFWLGCANIFAKIWR